MKWRHLGLIVPLTVDHANEKNNANLLIIFALKSCISNVVNTLDIKTSSCFTRIVAKLKEIFLYIFMESLSV